MRPRSNNTRRRAALAWAACWAIAASGCGGAQTAQVTGRLQRTDGSPLSGVRVTARSNETGRWASGMTDADGRYELRSADSDDGLPPGDYYVIVIENQGGIDDNRPPTIAAKYSDPAQSGLSFSVTAGEEKVFDATLEPP